MRLPPESRGYQAALEHAAMRRTDRGLIAVSGRDRASYLQGLLTNDTVALQPGQGCYSAYLTPQGRMITDMVVHELGDVILVALPRATRDTVLAKLDQFIFSEDVQLGDLSDAFAAFDIVGPDASALVAPLARLPVETLAQLPEYGALRAVYLGEPVIVRRVADYGVRALELLIACEHASALEKALQDAGLPELDDSAAEALRIEAGYPLFGRDMDQETIPLEAGIEQQAISFTKGCYVGQEVIIRVLHRGHGRVARKLVGLAFDAASEVPPPATTLVADDKDIGTITSSALSPALERPIALAYVKRDFVAPGTRVATAGGAHAEVVPLPFVTR